jgi:hypothetical protein
LRPGEKVQVIDVSLLSSPLQALADDPAAGGTVGHVAITPVDREGNVDQALLDAWADFRGTGQTHPLTAAVHEAVIEVRTGGRP